MSADQQPLNIALSKLGELYNQIPPVPCSGQCDQVCCVSPSCTLLEFLYLMEHPAAGVPQYRLAELLMRPADIHPRFEGNLFCRFEHKGRCLLHQGRTLGCRLFGIAALNELGIQNLENCTFMQVRDLPSVSKETLTGWLQEISDLNAPFYNYYQEPYWLAGLNIECWLAVYFNDYLDDAVFLQLKEILRSRLKLAFLKGRFRDPTNLKEKADKIKLLYLLMQSGDKDKSLELTKSLIEDYPFTGTYFFKEAQNIQQLLINRK